MGNFLMIVSKLAPVPLQRLLSHQSANNTQIGPPHCGAKPRMQVIMRDDPKAKIIWLLALTALLLLGVIEGIAAEPVTSSPTAPVTEAKPAIPTQTGPIVPPPASQFLGKRTCVTWDGTEFEWPFPNVPWNTRSCSPFRK
jgi:hypothetical protein